MKIETLKQKIETIKSDVAVAKYVMDGCLCGTPAWFAANRVWNSLSDRLQSLNDQLIEKSKTL